MRVIHTVLITFAALMLAVSARAARPTALPAGYMACPKPSDIHKNLKKRIWSNTNGWKSYEPSFATHIASFLGAQWQGVTVGNVSCLYKPQEGLTFPIILHFSRLTHEPAGKHWGKNLGGYMNCKSHHIKDCIFKPVPKPKHANIYDEARALKGASSQQLGF